MKRILFIVAVLAGMFTANAQNVETFHVGPYTVDYYGSGDVRYRLRDNIDLREYFGFTNDTVMVLNAVIDEPLESAFTLSGKVGTNRYAAKEMGLELVWKKAIANQVYFNAGAMVSMGCTTLAGGPCHRMMLEAGVPLQIEFGRLSRQSSSLYFNAGVIPTYYSTMKAEVMVNGKAENEGEKKSGLLVAPVIEFGGNVALNGTIVRIGVYGEYKVNCSAGDFNVYKKEAGCAFIGAKIGLVL